MSEPPASRRLHGSMLADLEASWVRSVTMNASKRPDLSAELSGAELQRWYWTMAELQPFARELGLRAAGPKVLLLGRVGAHLDGRPFTDSPRQPRPAKELEGSIDELTVIPDGQRSTTELRVFFEDRIGPAFRFDGHMRAFLKSSGGATLGDAVERWYETRDQQLPKQSSSLEFNRFTKHWHEAHPEGSAGQAREAWSRYRALPKDERPPVASPLCAD